MRNHSSVTTDASNNRNKKKLEELEANGNSRFKRKGKQPVGGSQGKKAKVTIMEGNPPPYVETLNPATLQEEVQNEMKKFYESGDLTLETNYVPV